MTAELIATSQSGEVVKLDTAGTAIELSLQIAEVDDPNARRSPHTFNFRLPFTEQNSRFFEHYYDANIDLQSWSPHRITKATILDDGIEVMSGSLQLTEVNVTEQHYTCSVVESAGELFERIRGITWRDIIGEELDHACTAANVIASWNTANDISGAGAGVVVYPLIDMARWYVDRNWLYGNGYGIGNPLTPIDPKTLRPAISVPWLVRRICAYANIAVSGDFLDSEYIAHLYTPAGTNKEDMVGRPFYGFVIGPETNVTIGTTPTDLAFTNATGTNYDPDGLTASGIFTAPYTGTYQFTIALTLTMTGGYEDTLTCFLQRNDGTSWNHAQNYSAVNGSYSFTYTANIPMDAGQTLQFYAQHSIAQNSVTALTASTIAMPLYDIYGALAVCDVAANMPDITADQWLKAIVERFNLVLVQDDNDGVLMIPWNDYTDAGGTKDWTHKLDVASPITIRPTTNHLAKRIVYTDREGKDFRNDWWQRNTGYVRGAWIQDNPLDFATETKEVTSPFVPLRLQKVMSNWGGADQTNIPDCLVVGQWQRRQSEYFGTAATQNPWLGYYHGTSSIGNDATIYIGTEAVTTYPVFSEFNTSPVTASSFGINWGPAWPDFPQHPIYNGGGTGNYAWRQFHSRYHEQLYATDARVMECRMALDPSDVRNLKWNDQIWVRDAYWRPMRISGYAVGQKQLCSVTLLKSIDKAKYNCTIYPVSFNANGTIGFESKPGVSAPANQTCCEEYGYTWDPVTQTCRWKANDTTDVNPDPPVAPGEVNPWTPTPPDPIEPTYPINSWQNNNSNITQQQVPLSAFTNGGSTTNVSTPNGTAIQLKTAVIYDIEIVMNAVQTGGTSGNVGDVATGTYKMAVTTSGGVFRQLGTTTIVHEAGDFTPSVNIAVSAGAPPTLAIAVTSPAGVEAQWSGSATFTATDASFVTLPAPSSPTFEYLLFEDGDGITYENTTPIALQ